MSWFDNIGKIAKSAYTFSGLEGLVHDVSTAMSNDDPWYVDATNIVKDAVKVGTTPARMALKGALAVGEKSYEIGQNVRTGMVGAELKLPFMYNRFKNPGESYDQYVQRVEQNQSQITLGQATLSMFSPGKNAGENSGWFKDWTDTHADFLSNGFDIFNAEDRKAAFSDQNLGKFITGTTDLAAVTFIDPLMAAGFAGKGLSIIARAPMATTLVGAGETGIRAIPGSLTRAVFGKYAMTTDSIDNLLGKALEGEGRALADVKFLAESDAKTQYSFWSKKGVTHPEEMSYLFGKAENEQEVVSMFRAVIGKDTKAMAELADTKESDVLLALDALQDVPKAEREALLGRLEGDRIVDDAYNNTIDDYVTNLIKRDERVAKALDTVATGGQEFRGATFGRGPLAGGARKASLKQAKFFEPEVTLVQETALHPAVAIVQHAIGDVKGFLTEFRPSGVFKVTDSNSYNEFSYFLKDAVKLSEGKFRERAAVFADMYLKAASEGEKRAVIEAAESAAVRAIAPEGLTDDMVQTIYKAYDYRRARAIGEMKNRGFVSLLTDGGPVVAKAPVLQREGANVVVTMDLRKLQRAIKRHENVLPSILEGVDVENLATRGEKFLDTLDNFNDIFKTSVLLRLGYTMRNISEAQLSLLAKGFALPAAAASGGTEALGRFLSNRTTDARRMIDNVAIAAGRREDLGVMRHAIAEGTDQLRAIDLSRQQLANSVRERLTDIEHDSGRAISRYIAEQRAEGNLIGYEEAGAIVAPTEVKRLRAVLAELEAKTLYHGSTSNSLTLRENTPISASASPHIANRYTGEIRSFGMEQHYSETGHFVPIKNMKDPEKMAAAAERMKAEAIAATREGNIVTIRRGGKTFHTVNEDQIRDMDWRTLKRAVFRVKPATGSITPLRVYGKTLDLRKWTDIPLDIRESAFGGKIANWNEWNKSKGWQDESSPLFTALREHGYGSATVKDDAMAGRVSHVVLPEAIGANGRQAEAESWVQQRFVKGRVNEAFDGAPVEPALATPAERRAEKKRYTKLDRKFRRNTPVSPYYERDSLNAMINNGVEDAAAQIGAQYERAHARLDDLMARFGSRVTEAESLKVRKRLGYGYFETEAGGHKYTVPEAFQDASWYWGRTSAEDTWNTMVGSRQMAFTTGVGARAVREIAPNDPRYFEAWSNILNMHFRDPESGLMDDVVRQVLDGKDDEAILSWFKTREGLQYANDTYTTSRHGMNFHSIKNGDEDERLLGRISDTRRAVKMYIPDEDTAALLSAVDAEGNPLTGSAIESFLMQRFGSKPENLQKINGLLVTSSKEYRDQERIIDTFNRSIMRFLGSLPEDTFARHPLVAGVYKSTVRKNIDAIAAARGDERLTFHELNRAQNAAREEARREVERTLFTIVNRTGASSSQIMRLMFPFYAAYENTISRWYGIAKENPAVLTNAVRIAADVMHGMNVVDKDGNRVTDVSQMTGDENLIVQVPDAFIKSLPGEWQDVMQNAFRSISIPLSSLDVVTQGNPGNPGFGPYAVLPAYLVLKERPEFEAAFKPLFPAGMPSSATDIFLPSVVRRLKTMWTQDEMYVRTFNQMLRYETYNYNTGKRQDAPTESEVASKTNKFFMLRALTAISAPFALSPEADFYQQQYRQLQQQYADYVDPATGQHVYGMADAKFLEMYPDFFEATISLSQNVGGLEASQATIKNLRKFSNLMADASSSDTPELMGFLANDFDGQYSFSQAAYQWQYTHGAYPGATQKYRQNRNPQDLVREANIKRGWTDYRKVADQIDAYKLQNGITSNRDSMLDQYNEAKSGWLAYMREENPDWYNEYMSPDRSKYERRAQVLTKALNDKKWVAQNGNRPVVKAMAMYLSLRQQVATVLTQRDSEGGSRMLDATSNEDVQTAWDSMVLQLKNESPEFADFYNRYFPNDPVVL